MDDSIQMSNKQSLKQSTRLATKSMMVGCVFYILIDLLPVELADGQSIFDILTLLPLAILMIGLLCLPFSIAGGYALGWVLQKAQWYRQDKTKVILTGMIIAGITLLSIFVVVGFLGTCAGSHFARCGENFITIMLGIRAASFIKALFIAITCGGITAWQLIQRAQQEPA